MEKFQNSTRVFSDGGKFLYRFVPTSYIKHLSKFVKHDVVDCERAGSDIRDGVERHLFKINRLPFQIRIQELPKSMALEMIAYLINLTIECMADSIVPFDATESNVLYWNKPVFVDLDAVRPLTKRTVTGTMAKIAYLYNKYVRRLNIRSQAGTYNLAMIKKHGGPFSIQRDWTAPQSWRCLLDAVSQTKIFEPQTSWSNKYGPHHINHKVMRMKNAKIAGAIESMRKIKPMSILDIGCNKGYLCAMASEFVEHSVGFDTDEKCISIANELYRSNQKVNFARFGIEYLGDNWGFKQQRYGADMVVALAVTHHFNKAGLSPETICSTMAKLAKSWILIEDIANIAAYHKALKRQGFKLMENIPSQPKPRTLSLFGR